MFYRDSGRSVFMVQFSGRDGRRVRRSTGTTEASVARSMDGMLRELKDRRDWDSLELVISGAVSLGELWDAWRREDLAGLQARVQDRQLEPYLARWERSGTVANPETMQRYLSQVRTLIPERVATISGLTPDAVDQWLADTVGGTGSTRARYFAAVNRFTAYLVSIGVLPRNPLLGVTRPKSNPPRCRHLSLEDAQKVVNAASGEHRVLYALAYGAGAELGAALKVTRGDVDLARKEVRLRGTKTAWRDRPARVADWAWPVIAEACKGRLPGAPLFRTRPISEWSREHRKLVASLGFDVTLHDARHHWAVRMARTGMPAEMIARQLGHKDGMMVLKVYGRFFPSSDERDRWERRATEMERAAR